MDEVDGRNDYGRDLNVDITEEAEITGAVIAVQAKGERRYIKVGSWELPATPKDLRYWAESSVPIVGVLWNPDNSEMRWINLTAFARTDPTISNWPPGRRSPRTQEPAEGRVALLPDSQVLTAETLPGLVGQMRTYLRQSSASALLGLFDSDDQIRNNALLDCWALGRTDARAFMLLRWALPSLSSEVLLGAIIMLSHLTPQPDIFWHAGNWIPPEIEERVQLTFRWSAQEIYHMVSVVESLDEPGWERGGFGQSLWSLLIEDSSLKASIPAAIELAVGEAGIDVAFRLLVIHQYLADDSLTAAEEILVKYPTLGDHHLIGELMDLIAEFGRIDVY